MAVVRGGTWGKAQQVPGVAGRGDSGVVSMSCASPGNCGAGGFLPDGVFGQQAFVVSEKNGIWGKAEVVRGSVALDTGRQGQIDSVSCASPGNCTAAGEYATLAPRAFPVHAFVVSEKNGAWGKAAKVPGIAAISKGSQAQISSVSCASPGNCSAGGSAGPAAFVVSQKNGAWGKAELVPGLAALTTNGRFSEINSVSCGAPGACSAGGDYQGHGFHGFVVSQQDGRWGEVLTIRHMDDVSALSCASAGNCSAGGGLFAVSEKHGTWGQAEEIPGLAALARHGSPFISSVSCASAGNCSAGGSYNHGSVYQGFVVSETNGTWRRAIEAPGLGALNTRGLAAVNAVSCGAAGNCAAVGYYDGRHGHQGFVLSQDNGVWGKTEQVPGLAALSKAEFAEVSTVSCASAGKCGAGGFYTGRSGTDQAFVVGKAR